MADVRPLIPLLCCGFLTNGCADEMAAYSPPPEAPTNVVQNLHYTTNIYNTPTSTFAVDTPPRVIPSATAIARSEPLTLLPPPPPPPSIIVQPPLPTATSTGISIIAPPPVEALPRKVTPVGIASCDAYLTHVEVCSRRMMSKTGNDTDEAIAKIVLSLDMSRRAWRNALPDMSPRARASLAETCSDSIRLYDMGAKSACAE